MDRFSRGNDTLADSIFIPEQAHTTSARKASTPVLRHQKLSEAERQAIEAAWDTERSWSLYHLGGTRRNGLRFVKAVKTDEEWTRESRVGISSLNKPKTSREVAEENARWYRELVSGSSGRTTREGSSNGLPENSTVEARGSVASTSKVTLEHLAEEHSKRTLSQGRGTKNQPFTLDDDDEEDTVVDSATRSTEGEDDRPESAELDASRHQHQAGKISATADEEEHESSSDVTSQTSPTSQDPVSGETFQAEDAEPEPQDMYCLLCKTEVPAADVAGHRSTILHQLSRSSQKDDEPLVPPTHYGVRSSNVGYGMLQRLGWTEDTGLGSSQTGRKAPLKASDKHDRKGVGVDSKRRLEQEEKEGKIVKRTKQVPQAAAKPLARNRKELERAKKKEMQMFKEGLAYFNK